MIFVSGAKTGLRQSAGKYNTACLLKAQKKGCSLCCKQQNKGGNQSGVRSRWRNMPVLRYMYQERRSLGLITDTVRHTRRSESVGQLAL